MVIGQGYNTFPDGVEITPQRLQRPQKYGYFCHAERCSIHDAARSYYSTEGATMYATWAACTDCARGIIQAGITKLVAHKQARLRGEARMDERWRADIEFALELLTEAGVKLFEYDGKVFDYEYESLHSGEIWYP